MITATEFYNAFIKSTADFSNQNNLIHDKTQWTKIMLGDDGIIEATVSNIAKEDIVLKKEFYLYDSAILDSSDQLPFNKIEYRQPVNILALIEHENGRNPEEEFWKLTHYYSKLKVLIFYTSTPDKNLEYFKNFLNLVSDIHRRNISEEYLCIAGENFSASTNWRGWKMQYSNQWEELT